MQMQTKIFPFYKTSDCFDSLMNTEGDQMPRRILIVRPWYFEQVLG